MLVAEWNGIGVAAPSNRATDLIAGARHQLGVTVTYDPAYERIAFPGGDVPVERGVCSDVVVRAYRAIGVDLQVRVNADLSRNWNAYPHLWQLLRPDPNIDHRRVPNLETFFRRHGVELPITQRAQDYLVGDIVSWRLDNGLPHIGLVSRADAAQPWVIHNIGAGAQEEPVLFSYRIVGHFRYFPAN
jgi:uncharacterized protein YijF (DUF1287 family)